MWRFPMIRVAPCLSLKTVVLLAVASLWLFSALAEDVGPIQSALERQKAEEAKRKAEEERRKLVESGLYYTDWPFDEAEAKRRQKLTAEKLALALEYEADLGNGLKMTFVLIPAGEFLMGSPADEADRHDDEGPVHRVRISRPFLMGKYEVTQAQWEKVMGKNPSHFQGQNNPVEQVSWEDCQEFIRKLNERDRNTSLRGAKFALPTEAQWEYACRAGSGRRFSFGGDDTDLGAHAWYDGNSERKTHAVGEKKPNARGLYDMHGNVWEWCGDWFAAYDKGDVCDPSGTATGSCRVLRGGDWDSSARFCRAAFRGRYTPGYLISLGARLALPVVQR
jgi:formylglycine-generating enzyme required for sulfatase activity